MENYSLSCIMRKFLNFFSPRSARKVKSIHLHNQVLCELFRFLKFVFSLLYKLMTNGEERWSTVWRFFPFLKDLNDRDLRRGEDFNNGRMLNASMNANTNLFDSEWAAITSNNLSEHFISASQYFFVLQNCKREWKFNSNKKLLTGWCCECQFNVFF